MVTIDRLQEVATAAPYSMVPPPTPYYLPFRHNTKTIDNHSALWHFKVIQGQWFLCHLKAKMRLPPISDQQQSRPYVAPFSHNTSVTDRQTDDNRRQPYHELDRYVSTNS